MVINTIKPDEDHMYVRIIAGSITPSEFVYENLKRVAKVVAETHEIPDGELGHDLIFIELDGQTKVLNRCDIEYITARKYFEGVLKDG